MKEISLDEREKIREEERKKIMKEMKREKHASYSSHDSCNSLSEEINDYYKGRHSSRTKHHSQRRENNQARAFGFFGQTKQTENENAEE